MEAGHCNPSLNSFLQEETEDRNWRETQWRDVYATDSYVCMSVCVPAIYYYSMPTMDMAWHAYPPTRTYRKRKTNCFLQRHFALCGLLSPLLPLHPLPACLACLSCLPACPAMPSPLPLPHLHLHTCHFPTHCLHMPCLYYCLTSPCLASLSGYHHYPHLQAFDNSGEQTYFNLRVSLLHHFWFWLFGFVGMVVILTIVHIPL